MKTFTGKVVVSFAIALAIYALSYIPLTIFGAYAEIYVCQYDGGFLNAKGVIRREWHLYGTYYETMSIDAGPVKIRSLIGFQTSSIIPKSIYIVYWPFIYLDKRIIHTKNESIGTWISRQYSPNQSVKGS